MRTKLSLPLVFTLLVTTVLLPRPGFTQGRDIGLGSAQAGAGGKI